MKFVIVVCVMHADDLVGCDHLGSAFGLLRLLLAHCFLRFDVVVVVVVHALLRRVLAARVRARSHVLLVDAAPTWSSSSARGTNMFTAGGYFTHWILATLHNRLHLLLLRVEVRVQDFHELQLIFLAESLELLDVLDECLAFALLPHLGKRVDVLLCLGQQTAICDSTAAKEERTREEKRRKSELRSSRSSSN